MIYDDTICTLGEGPLWHPERGELFWFDILSKRLHIKGRHWQFTRHTSAAGWIDDDRLLIADSIGLHLFDLASGTADLVADLEPDNPVTRSNDGRADPWGGFWIGTMGLNADPNAGAIYRYYKGELRKLYDQITISNAICFAPDGSHACFTDTPTGKVMRQRLSDKDGWPVGDPEPYLDLSGEGLNPDGAIIDADGHLLVAQWGANRVARYTPDGHLTESFTFPGSQTSCPALGGPDLSTLFCTSAAIGVKGPDDGKTFATPTQLNGQKEHAVIL